MKICYRCDSEFEEFLVNKKSGKTSSVCKECKRKYDREYYLKRPDTRKHLKYEQQILRRVKTREWLFDILKKGSCVDCGENNPLVLDFDHLRDKEFNISEGMQGDMSIERLKSEIEKCEIRCANCHRIKTAYQLNNWKVEFINRESDSR